jgi:hypothetical protein
LNDHMASWQALAIQSHFGGGQASRQEPNACQLIQAYAMSLLRQQFTFRNMLLLHMSLALGS